MISLNLLDCHVLHSSKLQQSELSGSMTFSTPPGCLAGFTQRPLIQLKLDIGTLKLCLHPIIIGGACKKPETACDLLTACAPRQAATPPIRTFNWGPRRSPHSSHKGNTLTLTTCALGHCHKVLRAQCTGWVLQSCN